MLGKGINNSKRIELENFAVFARLGFAQFFESIRKNEHKFRVGNCVQVKGYQFRVGHSWRVKDDENGYVVRVTPKKVFYVMETDIFHKKPVVHHIKNDRVTPMRPYYAAVPVEVVQNWRTCTWASMK